MPTSSGGRSGTSKAQGKGGLGGQASNAALQDDEDMMHMRGKWFRGWVEAHKRKKINTTQGKGAAMTYPYSNMPAARPEWNPSEKGD